MRWGVFVITAIIVIAIVWFEWPQVKQYPKRDKQVFYVLLFIGLALSLFDLPFIPGPITLLESLFKPFGKFMELY